MSSNTEIDRPNVEFRSVEGTVRQIRHPERTGDGRKQVDRHQVHGVPEKYPDKDRQRQRCDNRIAAVERILNLGVNKLDMISQKFCSGPGTSLVALRAALMNSLNSPQAPLRTAAYPDGSHQSRPDSSPCRKCMRVRSKRRLVR